MPKPRCIEAAAFTIFIVTVSADEKNAALPQTATQDTDTIGKATPRRIVTTPIEEDLEVDIWNLGRFALDAANKQRSSTRQGHNSN